MARKLILENLMKLDQSIGANPSKFMGTKTNISFLGKGPQKNPLFQRPLTGRDVPAAIHSRDALISATEDAMGFATANKLNGPQANKLLTNMMKMDEFYNPPAAPANITDLATGTRNLDQEGLASLRERTGDTP